MGEDRQAAGAHSTGQCVYKVFQEDGGEKVTISSQDRAILGIREDSTNDGTFRVGPQL